MHPSCQQMWDNYLSTLSEPSGVSLPLISAWHFCDNEREANECARLVLSGVKQATSPSLWELKASGEKIPEPGDLHIVTDWDGNAQCIIQTTHIEIVPFNKVTSEHARREGEGDGSLEFWREVHWEYYRRVLKGTDYSPSKNMPVVCEQFKVVYPENFAI